MATPTSAKRDGHDADADAIRVLTEVFHSLLESVRANTLTVPSLSRELLEVSLGYQGYRQLLGRADVSVLVEVARNPKSADVIDLRGPIPDTRVTIVAFDLGGREIGRDAEHARDGDVRHATIPGLTAGQVVARVEVLDEQQRPILFGGTIPAVVAAAAQAK
jgi:hypothetical protein